LLLHAEAVHVVGDDLTCIGEFGLVPDDVGVDRSVVHNSFYAAGLQILEGGQNGSYFLISLTPSTSSTANCPVVSTCTPTTFPARASADSTGASTGDVMAIFASI